MLGAIELLVFIKMAPLRFKLYQAFLKFTILKKNYKKEAKLVGPIE